MQLNRFRFAPLRTFTLSLGKYPEYAQSQSVIEVRDIRGLGTIRVLLLISNLCVCPMLINYENRQKVTTVRDHALILEQPTLVQRVHSVCGWKKHNSSKADPDLNPAKEQQPTQLYSAIRGQNLSVSMPMVQGLSRILGPLL